MMDGITILNQTLITEMVVPNRTLCFIAAAIFVISLVFTLESFTDGYDIMCGISAVICIVSIILVVSQVLRIEEIPTGRYEYEVTIDESVQFTDIYENYEVVEQRGEIWVLEDKDD